MMLSTLADRAGLDVEAELATAEGTPPVEAMLDLMLRTGPYELSMDDLRAAPHGIDLGPLEPRLPGMLRTASGKVEVAPDPIIDDLARLVAALEEPPDERLLLVGRRHLRSNNSWMHNIEVLVKGRPRCTLQLHPEDATARGVTDGDSVVVRSDVGEVEAVVEVTDDIAVGTVSLPHGWGHGVEGTRGRVAATTSGVNSNVLTGDQAIDPLSGNARLNAIPVEVLTPARVGG
jgi:anaerobic selenocysteine-containing dehydrogenase